MAYRKMGTAAVNGSALDRLAGKVAERSEALVSKWAAQAGDGGGTAAIEVDIDDAAQAVTLEVIHEALFSEQLDVIAEEPGAVALKKSFRRFNVVGRCKLNSVDL
jgi:cytochrome P450